MPKRSNEFQRLITRIYEQLAPLGGRVTESVLLPERNGGEREVDILMETPGVSPDRPMRTAVECRDHRRLADKTWIDQIYGKYRDIEVDRIVAVSRTGFSRGAKRKAEQCRIQTMTLAEALERDWPTDVFGVEIEEVSYWPCIERINVTAIPPWEPRKRTQSISVDGRTVEGSAFLAWLAEEMAHSFKAYVEEQRVHGNASFDHPGTFPFATTLLDVSDIKFKSPTGTEHQAREITLFGSVEVKRLPLDTRRYIFDGAAVTHSPLLVDGGRTEIMTVQRVGEAIKVRITRLPLGKSG